MNRPWLIALSAWALLSACQQPAGEHAGSLPIVSPPATEDIDPVVAETLAEAWTSFEGEKQNAAGAALGAAYGRLGLVYQANHFLDAARDSYLHAVHLAPAQSRWLYYLGRTYQDAGDTAGAISRYRQYLKAEADYLPARIHLARLLGATGAYEQALEQYEIVLAKAPEHGAALAGMGEIALAQRNYADAAAYLRRALTIQPGATRLYHQLGLALRGLGNTEAAAAAFAQRGSGAMVFDDPLLAALGELSRSAAAYMDKALLAAKDGRYDLAAQAYAEAVRLDPDNHQARAGLAQALERLGRYDEALVEVNRVLAAMPEYALAYLQKGRLLERAGDDAGAAESYRRAVGYDATYTEARYLLGNALMRMGQARAAVDEYIPVAQALPDSVLVRFRLGLALMAKGDCEAAAQAMQAASDLNPSFGPVVQALVRNIATCPQAGPAARQQAVEDGRWLYQQLPNADHAEALAMALAADAQYPAAVRLQQEVMTMLEASGNRRRLEFARQNLARYEAGQAAVGPWPRGAEAWLPPRGQFGIR